MARQIKLTEIDDFFEELVVDLVAATTLEWTKRVKKATPVDTGRLRAAVGATVPTDNFPAMT